VKSGVGRCFCVVGCLVCGVNAVLVGVWVGVGAGWVCSTRRLVLVGVCVCCAQSGVWGVGGCNAVCVGV
jgi:hypothetical protein